MFMNMAQRLAAFAAQRNPDMSSSDRGNAMVLSNLIYQDFDEGATTSLSNKNAITALQVRISFLMLIRFQVP